jgi:hypothetical protein
MTGESHARTTLTSDELSGLFTCNHCVVRVIALESCWRIPGIRLGIGVARILGSSSPITASTIPANFSPSVRVKPGENSASF